MHRTNSFICHRDLSKSWFLLSFWNLQNVPTFQDVTEKRLTFIESQPLTITVDLIFPGKNKKICNEWLNLVVYCNKNKSSGPNRYLLMASSLRFLTEPPHVFSCWWIASKTSLQFANTSPEKRLALVTRTTWATHLFITPGNLNREFTSTVAPKIRNQSYFWLSKTVKKRCIVSRKSGFSLIFEPNWLWTLDVSLEPLRLDFILCVNATKWCL